MKQFFFTVTFAVMLIFTNTCAAQDIWGGRWSQASGTDYYIMDETIRDTTPPSAHDYRNFEVSIKLVRDGQIEDILTYSYSQARVHNTTPSCEDPWEYCLVRSQNEPVPPTVDSYMVGAVDKIFELSMEKLGWSYTIRNGHYY